MEEGGAIGADGDRAVWWCAESEGERSTDQSTARSYGRAASMQLVHTNRCVSSSPLSTAPMPR